jgi:DHA1 family bicyclomycin/chloramphenicol resistance-like MFS transporter
MTSETGTRRSVFIILILGSLTTISPVSIDMYLPAFPLIADALTTTTARVSLSLSSYLAGLAIGQLFYGPLLDRFGRKRPVYVGLSLYIATSLGCIMTTTVDGLIALRLVQALGGCAAGVAAMAMVRDFFPARDSAKIFSLLMLVLSVSPLLAPTLGSLVTAAWGWQGVFAALAVMVVVILGVVTVALPEGHQPDPTISLKPRPIAENFIAILREPAFHTYAVSGALAFGGLLVYVAGSPIVFMEMFHVSASVYGGIFALLSVGFIGGSQVNIALLRKFRSEQIFQAALMAQVAVSLAFLIGMMNGWLGLWSTVAFFFMYLSSLGLINPNAAALAVAPFTKNIGSATALMGFLQIGMGSLSSAAVGVFNATDAVPMVGGLVGTSCLAFAVLLIGKTRVAPVAA